jgi:hypothetical protein
MPLRSHETVSTKREYRLGTDDAVGVEETHLRAKPELDLVREHAAYPSPVWHASLQKGNDQAIDH